MGKKENEYFIRTKIFISKIMHIEPNIIIKLQPLFMTKHFWHSLRFFGDDERMIKFDFERDAGDTLFFSKIFLSNIAEFNM